MSTDPRAEPPIPAPPAGEAPPVPVASPPSSPPSSPGGPRSTRRRWLAAGILVGSLVGAAIVRHRADLLDLLGEAGHTLAGLGDVEWRDGDRWVPVAAPDARRRQWGATDTFLHPALDTVAPGLEIGDLSLRRAPNPQEVDVVVARVSPRRWRFRVLMDEEAHPVDWFRRKHGLALAINASYFSDEGPLGLVVSGGQRLSRPVAHRAAHFLVDGPGKTPRIVNQKRADTSGVREGFQGFPAIMSAGTTFGYMRVGGRGFDVWAVDRRSAGCVTRDGHVLLLATDTLTNGLTFDELATVMGGLGCVDAMGFDGGSSTAMSIRVKGYDREVDGVRPVTVVLGLAPLEGR